MQANAPVELTSVSTSVGHSCSWIGADDADHENNDEDRVQGAFMVFMVFKSIFFGFKDSHGFMVFQGPFSFLSDPGPIIVYPCH